MKTRHGTEGVDITTLTLQTFPTICSFQEPIISLLSFSYFPTSDGRDSLKHHLRHESHWEASATPTSHYSELALMEVKQRNICTCGSRETFVPAGPEKRLCMLVQRNVCACGSRETFVHVGPEKRLCLLVQRNVCACGSRETFVPAGPEKRLCMRVQRNVCACGSRETFVHAGPEKRLCLLAVIFPHRVHFMVV
ncbi:hypothetical protein E2C01_086773 [Portunus trituberculatus]|uniref:Uncharacterized protein n=1 Tax=Portunus trituberculatus TaxID=210409 RepID=A0A5B7JED2_PORTR|nr:hypothetical protein [Portunus trituberculatus]